MLDTINAQATLTAGVKALATTGLCGVNIQTADRTAGAVVIAHYFDVRN